MKKSAKVPGRRTTTDQLIHLQPGMTLIQTHIYPSMSGRSVNIITIQIDITLLGGVVNRLYGRNKIKLLLDRGKYR